MGKTFATDALGLVTYDLPETEYKVRGDYLGYQWWSDPFTWTASDVVIPEGEVTITVTDSGAPAQANVYVFTSGGSYMSLYAATDASGEVSFLLPADGGNSTNYNGYKFRADYSGTQTWSDPLLVTADVNNPVTIEVGGSAAIPSLRLSAEALRVGGSPGRSRGRGNPGEVQVASLFTFPGMLAGLSNSAIADSNGEYLYFYHSDHLGTPLFLTDVSGTVVWRGEYLPFGEVFSEDRDPDGDGVEVDQPFRFPGQYQDEETGLYYNYFRDYDPVLGRYVEADPIGLNGGVNLWGYVGQRPVSFVDQIGLCYIVVKYKSLMGTTAHHAYLLVGGTSQGPFTIYRAGPTYDVPGFWGPIDTFSGPYRNNAPDWSSDWRSRPGQVLLDNDEPCECYDEMLESALQSINNSGAFYNPKGPNSNSVINELINEIGFGADYNPVWAPGWDAPIVTHDWSVISP